MAYHYGLLMPLRAVGATAHNASWTGATTLGIEVTEPELAARCGLGNIDPQHLGGRPDFAAIEAAVTWDLPPDEARLVTLRPDADAVGAMAILTLRAEHNALSADTIDRVATVGQHDRFDFGPWPGLHALPVRVEDIDEVGAGRHGIGAIIAGLRETTIAEAIRPMMAWLTTGAAPLGWSAKAGSAAAVLFESLMRGEVVVRDVAAGQIACVEGSAPGALRLGYRRAPIVIAVNEAPDRRGSPRIRRITIAQHNAGYADLARVAAWLAREEPGWGGSTTIIGSPQGVGSTLSVDRCAQALRACGRFDLLSLSKVDGGVPGHD